MNGCHAGHLPDTHLLKSTDELGGGLRTVPGLSSNLEQQGVVVGRDVGTHKTYNRTWRENKTGVIRRNKEYGIDLMT